MKFKIGILNKYFLYYVMIEYCILLYDFDDLVDFLFMLDIYILYAYLEFILGVRIVVFVVGVDEN